MKKSFLLIALLAMALGAGAQVDLLHTLHKRDASNKHLECVKPQVPMQEKTPQAKTGGSQMPANFWFPGEWEEVQAIAVTCYYHHKVPGHENSSQWFADPQVTGYADYYYGSYNNQQGGGEYISVPDTTSTFGDVFFYLMDAIQMGGAEAWVRVENAEDSNIIKRKLDRMALRSNNLRFLVAPGTSFWFRDCGPICFYYGEGDTVGMLDFEYYPGRALDDSLPVYIERQFGIPNYTTMIEWEGGNCLVDGAGMVLSSDAIYSNNRDATGQITWDGTNPNTIGYSTKPRLTNAQVKDSLHALIGPRATYILPAFRYDGGTGHVDLYADMIDENLFVFSQMPEAYSSWYDYKVGQKNMDSLCSYQSYFGANYRRHYIPFPSRDNGSNFTSQTQYDNQYTRTYSNHTFVNNLIIQPCFSTVGSDGMPTAEWDRANIEELKKAYPGYTIYCVDVREFDGTGGAIHCVTKQIPAEHPIRILHQALHDNTGNTYASNGAPILAQITNVDGIDSAVVYYRFDGGQWQHVVMSPDSLHQYAAVIPTSGELHGDYTKVEYYISATSNAGKTITKPMTASQGGFFEFYLGTNPSVAVEAVEPEECFGQFYPNPSTEVAHLNVEMNGNAAYSIFIIDAAGRTVHTSRMEASGSGVFTVNTSILPSGVYNVVFQNDSERVVRRLIVK